jgi:hypothetical protein
MPAQDFFARMRPEFIEQQGSARVNAQRQAQVESLIGKAEYEFGKMRRDLGALLPLAAVPYDETAPVSIRCRLGAARNGPRGVMHQQSDG